VTAANARQKNLPFHALRRSRPTDDGSGRVSDHNDRCLTSTADALDWFDRAIEYAGTL
jgi:hypothetical protein